jgi:hypothetical protein
LRGTLIAAGLGWNIHVGSEMRFKIEVRERAQRPRFLATYVIEAPTVEAALAAAKQRFRRENPAKPISNYSFENGRA